MTDETSIIIGLLTRVQPGESISISHRELAAICRPAAWSAERWVLENMVGSAYEWEYTQNHMNRSVVFRRLAASVDVPLDWCKREPS